MYSIYGPCIFLPDHRYSRDIVQIEIATKLLSTDKMLLDIVDLPTTIFSRVDARGGCGRAAKIKLKMTSK
jgi:hypothetical protein